MLRWESHFCMSPKNNSNSSTEFRKETQVEGPRIQPATNLCFLLPYFANQSAAEFNSLPTWTMFELWSILALAKELLLFMSVFWAFTNLAKPMESVKKVLCAVERGLFWIWWISVDRASLSVSWADCCCEGPAKIKITVFFLFKMKPPMPPSILLLEFGFQAPSVKHTYSDSRSQLFIKDFKVHLCWRELLWIGSCTHMFSWPGGTKKDALHHRYALCLMTKERSSYEIFFVLVYVVISSKPYRPQHCCFTYSSNSFLLFSWWL